MAIDEVRGLVKNGEEVEFEEAVSQSAGLQEIVDLSKDWASKDEDDPVVTIPVVQYSAKHWAAKMEKALADQGVYEGSLSFNDNTNQFIVVGPLEKANSFIIRYHLRSDDMVNNIHGTIQIMHDGMEAKLNNTFAIFNGSDIDSVIMKANISNGVLRLQLEGVGAGAAHTISTFIRKHT